MHSRKVEESYNKNYALNFEYNKKFKPSLLSNLKLEISLRNKVNEKQLSLISGSLAELYKDGITITFALELISDTTPDKAYKNSLLKVLGAIKNGKSLSQGFTQFKNLYPEFFTGIIFLGESTGKLYETLIGLKLYYEKLVFIKKEIKNASAYPLFILLSMAILSVFVLNEVVPNFCEIYKSMNIDLPENCKILYNINLTIKENPLLSSITSISWLLALITILKYFINNITVDKFIKIRIVKAFFEYIMILLFSIITSTGINISTALEYCEESMSFVYLKRKIKEINAGIYKGKSLTESLEKSGLFSKYTLAVIRIHEESGSIEEGFKELAQKLEKNFFEQINKYLRLINPIFMSIMAGFIVMFILCFVIPLFDNLKSGIR